MADRMQTGGTVAEHSAATGRGDLTGSGRKPAVFRCAGVAILTALVLHACVPAIGQAVQDPPNTGNAPNTGEVTGIQAALALQEALVQAIGRAEKSVAALARVPKQDQRFDPTQLRQQLFEQLPLEAAEPTSPDFVPREFATAVVLSADGFLVTNYHVLGDPRENDYVVWLQGTPHQVVQVRSPEQVRAGDPWTDLAVLKIDATDLQPMPLGDASELKKGMVVLALGNPYAIARDGSPSASWGIISNLQRAAGPAARPLNPDLPQETLHHFGTLIQTDAKLNLGTSGGALLNLQGQMIGLTTSLAPTAGYETSAGFAIPVDQVFRETVETLREGRVPEFGFLGVQPENLTALEMQQGRFGARVLRVVPGTPAAKAGLEDGDVVTHVAGQEVRDKSDLFREMSKRRAGDEVQMTVTRFTPSLDRRRTLELQVKLSKKPLETSRPAFAQVPPRTWRGLEVDYATAIPQGLVRQSGSLADPRGCVGVLDVQRPSPAWDAGLRPGMFISHVGNDRVANPDEFYETVDEATGPVRLYIAGLRGEEALRTVQPTQP